MSRIIADAELEVWKPGESSSFVTVPNDDIEFVEINERVTDAMDSGELTVHNHDGTYTGEEQITSGDRLVFRTQLAGEGSLTDQWTAIVRNPTDLLQGGTQKQLVLEATDFVFTVLSWRVAYDSFEAEDPGTIVESLVDTEATEIGTSQIETTGTTTDQFYEGRKLMHLVIEDLAPIGDALVAQDGTDLVFKSLADIDAKHAFSPADFRGDISVSRPDGRIRNRIRVDGGEDHATDDEQTDQTSTTRVTSTSRITHQIQTRKSEVARVLIHTELDASSSDGVTVRLQADRSGSPVNPGRFESDIARRTLAKEFLADGDLTEFLLPAHTLPPESNPWLIIEGTGVDGQLIGVNGDGDPTFQAQFPYPLLSRAVNSGSEDAYRRRDYRLQDGQLNTFEAVRDKAQSIARHRAEPETTVSGSMQSIRGHNLSTGEAVQMTDWPVDVSGSFLCLERVLTYDGSTNRLETDVELQSVASL